ncbi:MAG: GspE/PulE family protein [Mariprofundaceae bacterium]|nr:GspE/PulE family protein [Mariprofundaceae bacterium]
MSSEKPKKSNPSISLENVPGIQFAKILLNSGLVSQAKIEKAIRVQKKLGENRVLSAIFIELGIITDDEHRRVIRKHGRDFRLGELAVELGYVSLKQLDKALDRMKTTTGKRMGEIMGDLGYINERQLAQVLSEQLSLPLQHIEFDMIDRKLLREFSLHFLKNNLIIPYEQSETKISLICVDPLNETAIRNIEQQVGKIAVVSIGVKSILEPLFIKLEIRNKQAGSDEQGDHIIEIVDSILLSAIRDYASDIHLEPLQNNMRIRFRMDGVLIHKMDLPSEMAHRVIARIKVLSEMDIADSRTHQDGRMAQTVHGLDVDFRVSTYVTTFGENLVMRILRRDGGIKSIDKINMNSGLLERFKHEVLDVPTGVVLITGPTGSGKTTTLYSAIDYLNRPSTKIITLEDPVEYVVDGIMQCSVDIKAGRNFEDSLKAIVRQDPDIIVLGEIRDKMSAQVAVQAALTGHKVLTTFHTEDSIGGLLRLMNMGIESFLISSTVVSILAQRLIRTICPDCRQAYMPNKRIAKLIGLDDDILKNHTFYRGTGCGTCYGTGYHGRTTLHELLVLNEDVREAILEEKTSHEIRQISCDSTNLLSLMEDGLYQVLHDMTTVEEVYRIAPRSLSNRSVTEICRLMGDEI